MKYYSFAGEASGTTDPEKTDIYNVDADDCGLRGCTKDDCAHTVIMWSGNEYSKNNTWISCDNEFVIDLTNAQ